MKKVIFILLLVSVVLISGCQKLYIDKVYGFVDGEVKISPLCGGAEDWQCHSSEELKSIYEEKKIMVYEQTTNRLVLEENLHYDDQTKSGKYSITLEPRTYIIKVGDGNSFALGNDAGREVVVTNQRIRLDIKILTPLV